jgi:hypothetical protein
LPSSPTSPPPHAGTPGCCWSPALCFH